MKKLRFILALLSLNLLCLPMLLAQNIEMGLEPDDQSSFQLDYTRLLHENSDLSIVSGNYLLRYKNVVNERINLVAEGVFNHFSSNGNSETSIGNIYLGTQFKFNSDPDKNASLNLGVFIPIADEEAASGLFSNFYDFGRYLDKNMAVQAGFTRYQHFEGGLRLGFELASLLAIPTNGDFQDPEVYAKYGLSLMYKAEAGFFVISEILGVGVITEDSGSFDDRTDHTYAFGAGFDASAVSVAFSYKNFIDDMGFFDLDGVLGIQLRFLF